MKKALIGLSGGMDSFECAKLLSEQGFELVGAFIAFCDNTSPDAARECAKKLGIKLIEADKRREFSEKVITPFINEYKEGRTPNPCALCNPQMKFKTLGEIADAEGADFIATGHYAKIGEENGKYHIENCLDEVKDQTYFLWGLDRNILKRTLFPLSDTVKCEIKKKNSDKKESMDICFIPDKDTFGFISKKIREMPKGEIVSLDGKILGKHNGIYNYTVGQRRGLGVAMGERAYVVEINKDTDKVILGKKEDMNTAGVFVGNLNFPSYDVDSMPKEGLTFKSRSRMKKAPCRVELSENGATVWAEDGMRRVAPGQSVVVYHENRIVFGGTAEKNLC